MKRATIILIMGMLVAAPLTGCIENMDDLKDRISGAQSDEGDDVNPLNESLNDNTTNGTTDASGNETLETKEPVARVTVYAPGGALLYRASFVAEDQEEPVTGEVGTYNLLAAESEALESTAKLESFEWVVDGEKHEGRKVSVDFTDPGIHMITLTVTDSYGKTDSQMVHVGVLPEPFDVAMPFTGDPGFGVAYGMEGEAQQIPFDVTDTVDGKTVSVTGFRASATLNTVEGTAAPGSIALTLYDAEGEEIAATPSYVDGIYTSPTIQLDSLPVGSYTLEIGANGAHNGYAGEIVVTYLEQIEGLGGGDGHGGHAH